MSKIYIVKEYIEYDDSQYDCECALFYLHDKETARKLANLLHEEHNRCMAELNEIIHSYPILQGNQSIDELCEKIQNKFLKNVYYNEDIKGRENTYYSYEEVEEFTMYKEFSIAILQDN